jgi:hypothetical protein
VNANRAVSVLFDNFYLGGIFFRNRQNFIDKFSMICCDGDPAVSLNPFDAVLSHLASFPVLFSQQSSQKKFVRAYSVSGTDRLDLLDAESLFAAHLETHIALIHTQKQSELFV